MGILNFTPISSGTVDATSIVPALPVAEYRSDTSVIVVALSSSNDLSKTVTVPDSSNGFQIFGQVCVTNLRNVTLRVLVDGNQLQDGTHLINKTWVDAGATAHVLHVMLAALATPGNHTVILRTVNNDGANSLTINHRVLKVDHMNFTQFDILPIIE